MTSLARSDGELPPSFWLECEVCAKKSLITYDTLVVTEQIIAKGLELSELARIARVETRMRELLLKQWEIRSRQAVKAALATFRSSGNLSSALNRVDAFMDKWPGDVEKRYAVGIEEIYKLARTAGWKKASGRTKSSLAYTTANFTEVLEEKRVEKAAPKASVPLSFDLYDESAVAALHGDQMVWIGDHYDKNVRKALRDNARAAVEGGVGRLQAGKQLEASVAKSLKGVGVPGGWSGSSARYFEGLAANTATNARVRGQMRSFVDLGVRRYVIVNPNDERTSTVCQHMSGKTFTVDMGTAQIESEAGATRPDDIKAAHPWLSFSQVQAISPKAGPGSVSDADALAKAGMALPPYHFRCRSTIDLTEESFSALTPQEIAASPKPVERPAPKPKTVAVKPSVKPKPVKAEARPATIPKPTSSANYDPAKFKVKGEGFDEVMEKTFGKRLTEGEWKQLAGGRALPEDAVIKLRRQGNVLELGVNHNDFALVRSYTRRRGELLVEHEFFRIKDAAKRGKGLGKTILREQVLQYRALGVNTITLSTAWDGRYVWPKMGFQTRESFRPVRIFFQEQLVARGMGKEVAAKVASQVEDIHELALAKVGDRQVGKEFLLSPANEHGHVLEAKLGPGELSGKRLMSYLGIEE